MRVAEAVRGLANAGHGRVESKLHSLATGSDLKKGDMVHVATGLVMFGISVEVCAMTLK